MARKILLTGGTGLLGISLIARMPFSFTICAGYYKFPKDRLSKAGRCEYREFDITSRDQVRAAFKGYSPDTVIHAASIGNVDYCEKNKNQAELTNIIGSRNMIEACAENGCSMIFTSSNAVFDGEHPPYDEAAAPNPVDYYGITKLETEKALASSGIKYSIVRLMTMYGWNHPLERQNPVTWILERLLRKERLNIVNDIYNNHLFAGNAAEAIWAIVRHEKEGIYHIAGGETVSRYDLALNVADCFGLDRGLINPVASSFFSQLAQRPKNTSYKIDKMEKDLLVRGLGIREGLEAMKADPPRGWKYDWM
ncbi:MAG: NAD(P)-dependent oxidoreductase [Candidatus Omnitrophica bacterium]|nr:NAD(P)-dependent oxidoreductase [Candidatus Omnitrophota bacterium]